MDNSFNEYAFVHELASSCIKHVKEHPQFTNLITSTDRQVQNFMVNFPLVVEQQMNTLIQELQEKHEAT
jgi:hypothetical protein